MQARARDDGADLASMDDDELLAYFRASRDS
jgi:hypothetical protein